jgi:proline iminopeptidase
VDGARLRPRGPWLEEVPTVVLVPLGPGPGADHSSYKDILGPRLAGIAQVVYVDPRGDGRSDRSNPSRWNLDSW